MKQIYLPNVELAQAKSGRNDSLVWRSFIHGRDVLFQSGTWLIGDEKYVDIVEDAWLPGGEKAVLTRANEVERVFDTIDTTNSCWDMAKIRSCFSPITTMKILQVPISWREGPDVFWWPHARSGLYYVKSGYLVNKQIGISSNFSPSTSRGSLKQFGRLSGRSKFVRN